VCKILSRSVEIWQYEGQKTWGLEADPQQGSWSEPLVKGQARRSLKLNSGKAKRSRTERAILNCS